jgi:alkanesulfonate monooxygenase
LLEYVEAGVTTLLIRGYDPLRDAIAYREVIEIVRQEVARGEVDDAAVAASTVTSHA